MRKDRRSKRDDWNYARDYRILQIVCSLAMLLLMSCGKEENVISLTTPETAELYSVTNQTAEIKFKTDESWKATCAANWVTFSPKSGKAGENVITIATTSTNRTKKPRMAQLTIESGGTTKNVNIKQRDEYAYFDLDEWVIDEGGAARILTFRTNLKDEDLLLLVTEGLDEWVKLEPVNNTRSRTDYTGETKMLYVGRNSTPYPREGAFFLAMKDNQGNLMGLDTLWLHQDPYSSSVSADFSQDGKVKLLNEAKTGKGIPFVLMGDGFIDQDIDSDYYDEVMNQTMENLFSEEPIKSLRDYFNVYQVTAVSARNRFDGASTVFRTMPDHKTTGISVDANRVMDYVKKVEGIDSIHALAVVILNTNLNKGVTYMIRDRKQSDYNYAIALCPVINSLENETFRQVLTHEAIGHGFAKLADEYVRSTEGSATDADIKRLKEMHEKWSWYLNIDSEKDSTKVLWSRFIYDDEFANEKIGTYEGGYTFFKGVYRPSEGSMMNQNDSPFNAPSRQIIYNKVMQLGLDKQPSYEEFVEFDRQHKPENWPLKARTRQTGWDTPWRPAPPRVIWR